MNVYCLAVALGPCKGRSFTINSFPTIVGGHIEEEDGISLEDDSVQEQHIRIKKLHDVLIIEDLNTSSGTYLNGHPIKTAQLSHNDSIRLGNTELLVRVGNTTQGTVRIQSRPSSLQWGIKKTTIPANNHDIIFASSDASYQPLFISDTQHPAPTIFSKKEKPIAPSNQMFLLRNTIEEDSKKLLSELSQKIPDLKKALILFPDRNSQAFVPRISMHFESIKTPFMLYERAIRDAYFHQSSLLMTANTHPHPQHLERMLIPVLSRNKVIAMVHFERDIRKTARKKQLEGWSYAQALISQMSPYLDIYLLQSEVDEWTWSSVNALLTAMEAKDTYTVGHCERVSRYAMAMADELGLVRDVKRNLMMSALLHDIGKIGTPDYILKNSTALSHEEYEEIKLHPAMGDKIIRQLPNYHDICAGIKYHHERKDGTGYPEGLSGDAIPFFGRLVAVADCFDAMISGRSYSGFMSEEYAVEQLLENVDSFDADILQALERAYNHGSLSLRTGTMKKQIAQGP